ncbi:MAG: LacI family transcriptional regulator [Devosia sp.]
MNEENAAATASRTRRATLKTISDLTGLSLSTVSLGLRGGEALREETVRKITDAAASVGYVPDRAGVRLRTGKTNVVALVLDGADDSIDFARHAIRGVGHGIRGTRYHLTVTPEFDQSQSVDSIRYILEHRTADGVIITHTGAHDPRVKMLTDAKFPFVTHGRTEFLHQHPFHDFRSEAFAELAVERLASKGCKSIMLMIGDDKTFNYQNIVGAFQAASTRLGIEARLIDPNIDRATAAELRQLGRGMATDPGRPDGYISASEMRAISIIGGLIDGGAALGTDVHVVSKQTSDILTTFFPHIDTIEEDVYAAGRELARLLLRRIKGEPVEALQSLSEPVPHWRS